MNRKLLMLVERVGSMLILSALLISLQSGELFASVEEVNCAQLFTSRIEPSGERSSPISPARALEIQRRDTLSSFSAGRLPKVKSRSDAEEYVRNDLTRLIDYNESNAQYEIANWQLGGLLDSRIYYAALIRSLKMIPEIQTLENAKLFLESYASFAEQARLSPDHFLHRWREAFTAEFLQLVTAQISNPKDPFTLIKFKREFFFSDQDIALLRENLDHMSNGAFGYLPLSTNLLWPLSQHYRDLLIRMKVEERWTSVEARATGSLAPSALGVSHQLHESRVRLSLGDRIRKLYRSRLSRARKLPFEIYRITDPMLLNPYRLTDSSPDYVHLRSFNEVAVVELSKEDGKRKNVDFLDLINAIVSLPKRFDLVIRDLRNPYDLSRQLHVQFDSVQLPKYLAALNSLLRDLSAMYLSHALVEADRRQLITAMRGLKTFIVNFEARMSRNLIPIQSGDLLQGELTGVVEGNRNWRNGLLEHLDDLLSRHFQDDRHVVLKKSANRRLISESHELEYVSDAIAGSVFRDKLRGRVEPFIEHVRQLIDAGQFSQSHLFVYMKYATFKEVLPLNALMAMVSPLTTERITRSHGPKDNEDVHVSVFLSRVMIDALEHNFDQLTKISKEESHLLAVALIRVFNFSRTENSWEESTYKNFRRFLSRISEN